MADRLRRLAGAIRPRPATAAWLLAISVSVQAELLPDPTRPAPGFGSEPPASIGTPGVGEGGPVLQTVILPRKGKPKAVIGGELVTLGGKYGDQTLVKVGEREVVLEGPRGREVLKLTPGIEKKAVRRSPRRPLAGESKP